MRDADFMKRAIDLSREKMIAGLGAPFAAVIVKDGKIVGEGWNTVSADHDPTAHGEVAAIRDACRRLKTIDLSGCTIYTSCEPCPLCVAAMWLARLDRVCYANALADTAQFFDIGELMRDVARPIGQRSTPAEQMMAAEAFAVIKQWVDQAGEDPLLKSMLSVKP